MITQPLLSGEKKRNYWTVYFSCCLLGWANPKQPMNDLASVICTKHRQAGELSQRNQDCMQTTAPSSGDWRCDQKYTNSHIYQVQVMYIKIMLLPDIGHSHFSSIDFLSSIIYILHQLNFISLEILIIHHNIFYHMTPNLSDN